MGFTSLGLRQYWKACGQPEASHVCGGFGRRDMLLGEPLRLGAGRGLAPVVTTPRLPAPPASPFAQRLHFNLQLQYCRGDSRHPRRVDSASNNSNVGSALTTRSALATLSCVFVASLEIMEGQVGRITHRRKWRGALQAHGQTGGHRDVCVW